MEHVRVVLPSLIVIFHGFAAVDLSALFPVIKRILSEMAGNG